MNPAAPKKTPRPTLVMFDMDGTLLESMAQWNDLFSLYLAEKGLRPDGALIRKIIPMSAEDSLRFFRNGLGISDPPETIQRDLDALMRRQYETVEPKPHAMALLAKLRALSVKVLITTGTTSALFLPRLRALGVTELVDKALSCDDMHSDKHAPDIWERGLALTKTPREQAIVVEDSLFAIRTAKAAGFRVWGVYDRCSRSDADQIRQSVEFFMDSLADFLPRFQSLPPVFQEE